MNRQRHRHPEKSAKRSDNTSVSASGVPNKDDAYLAIWVLKKLGWSARRIAKLNLPTSHHTITNYFSEACELIKEEKLPIMDTGKESPKLLLSEDLEYLDAKVNQNPCGGGRRVMPHHYGSDWDD
ncbi:MAG: hypothetical protein AB1611_12830 [bacterium]